MDSKSQQLPDRFAPYTENSPFLMSRSIIPEDGWDETHYGFYVCEHH